MFASTHTSAQRTVGQVVEEYQTQRIQAAYVLVNGRLPNTAEIAYWIGEWKADRTKSLNDLMVRLAQHFKTDVNAHKGVIQKAYQDALGRPATDGANSEVAHWTKGYDNYTDLMKNHVIWLQGNSYEYEKVIVRAYKYVFGSRYKVTTDEIKFWKGLPTYSYVILVASMQDHQRKNSSRDQKSNIALSPAMVSANLSPVVFAEVRGASGIVAAGAGNIVAAGAGNIVAAGAGNVVSNGSAGIVAAGAGNIVAAGGLN